MEGNFLRLLTNRFKIDKYIHDHPSVLDGPVRKPVIVVGLTRTGSTLTVNLLGTDPGRRSLLSWERLDGIPPATSETLRTDPRCLMLKARDDIPTIPASAGADSRERLHAMHRDDADGPSECNMVLAYEFWSTSIEALYPMPGYREWLLSQRGDAAYAVHKRMLQILQSKAPGTWNLKTPMHSLGIDALIDTYPDARIIWTHRDPLEAVGSHCSLISAVHSSFGVADSRADIAAYYPRQLSAHVERLMAAEDAGKLHDANRLHLPYRELMRDPIGQMRRIYEWLGDEFDESVNEGMKQWLQRRPKDVYGKHSYSISDFGIDAATLNILFSDYISRYGHLIRSR